MPTLQVSILGPVAAAVDGAAVEVTGGRVRTLLARLAVAAGRPVPAGVLVDAIWGDRTPADPTNALQTLVSRLRRALGDPDTVAQEPGGYRLVVAPDDVDAERFLALARAGRAALHRGEPDAADHDLQAALALWRGPALPELDDGSAAVRLDDQRLDALEDHLTARIQLGRARDVTAECEALATGHPLQERFVTLLMTALRDAGRVNEALVAYDRARRVLRQELGTDPSAGLQALHLTLLRAQSEPSARPKRTNLRAGRTSFIGREEEAKRIRELLGGGRLVTVVGPGGAGKTRLAEVAGTEWIDRLEDGVWLVELAPVTDPANLAQAVLVSLGLRTNLVLERLEKPAVSSEDRLLEMLAGADCLLVLDNCEHLIAGAAELTDRLLSGCPRLRVLATSREPLGIDGEALCLLAPLELPDLGAGVAEAQKRPAVQLFSDRATAVAADFAIDENTVGAVVEIVRRLDGLPLAIELAAARLRVLPVQEIAARLSDRFRLLTGGNRAAMPRHRTLRAVVEWSWQLLAPAERMLAERLAVFHSGATVSGATQICAHATLLPGLTADESDIADLLNQLVDKSLLQADRRPGLRYRMLETLREYGIEQLGERIDDVRLVHAQYYAALVAEAEPWLTRAEQVTWMRRLDAERDNILGALRYLGDSGKAAAAVGMARTLGWYWTLLDEHSEASRWLKFALDVPDPGATVSARDRVFVEALQTLNNMAIRSDTASANESDAEVGRIGRIDAQLAALSSATDPLIALLRPMLLFFSGATDQVFALLAETVEADDPWVRATAHMFRAAINENEGRVEPMRADVDTALALFTTVGERWGTASTLSTRAQLYVLDGEIQLAVADLERSARIMTELGAVGDEVMLHLRLAGLYARIGDYGAARREADLVETLDFEAGNRTQRMMADGVRATISMLVGDHATTRTVAQRLRADVGTLEPIHPMSGHVAAMALAVLGRVDVELGDLDAAAVTLRQAHTVGIGTRDMPVLATVGLSVAYWAEAGGDVRAAAQMVGACAALRGATDPTDPLYQRLLARLRHGLGDTLDHEVAIGRAMDRDTAIARIRP